MKLNVQGIEEIVITDPSGLCNPPTPTPTPPLPGIYTRRVGLPLGSGRVTRHEREPGSQWAVGGQAIRRAGEQVEIEKWQGNYRAGVTRGS